MDVNRLLLSDCYEINSYIHRDPRGVFAKFCINQAFNEVGLDQGFAEDFFTVSKNNVIRGMHFQVPPKSQYKVICCMRGRIIDVLLDLRIGSPTYLNTESMELSGNHPKLIFMPPGIAHGFLSLEDDSIMLYKVNEGYSRELDQGIRWNSFGYKWSVETPITSERDDCLPLLSDFISPLRKFKSLSAISP